MGCTFRKDVVVGTGSFTIEQLELAQWLVDNAAAPLSQGFMSQMSVPDEKGGSRQSAAFYTLAAQIATSQAPGHYVLYVAEYQMFFFQPRPTSYFTTKK